MELKWKSPLDKRGILVYAGEGFEKLLKVWYQNTISYSDLPIHFVDLGMCESMKGWCEDRGSYQNGSSFLTSFKNLYPNDKDKPLFDLIVSGHDKARPYWFVKPLAMLQTPFEETLYLDVDCKIRGDIEEVFSLKEDVGLALEGDDWHAMLLTLGLREPLEKTWNSGVIYYRHGAPLIKRWAEEALCQGGSFLGDQDLLARVIFKENFPVTELSRKWNWNVKWGENNEVIIYHYTGNSKHFLLNNL